MSWPIGYGDPTVMLRNAPGGGITANGVRITDVSGWIHLDLPYAFRPMGAPERLALRLRLSPDAEGTLYLFADDAIADGEHHGSIFRLLTVRRGRWSQALRDLLFGEIDRRITGGAPASASTPPRGVRVIVGNETESLPAIR